MLSNITLGQYYPTDSIIHKLDPRLKTFVTLLYMLLVFFARNYYSIAVLYFFVLLITIFSKIPFKMYLKSIKMILFVILLTSIMNLFYGTGPVVFEFWTIKVTENGINNSIFVALRFFILILTSSILTYVTTPSELTSGIESLLKPLAIFKLNVSNFAMMVTIALRFVPTLLQETDKISKAQKARGAQIGCGNLKQRAKSLIPILIPLFMSSFRKANDLAIAMECRCYNYDKKRSKMYSLKFKKSDFYALVLTLVSVLIFFTFNQLLKAVNV